MPPQQILETKFWEIGMEKKSASWLSGTEFCRIIEEKNISEIIEMHKQKSFDESSRAAHTRVEL